MVAKGAIFLLVFCLSCCAAGGRETIRPLAGEKEMALQVDCTPPEAEVRVDGSWQGSCASLNGKRIKLASGRHSVEVSAPGFRTYSGMVEAEAMLQQLSINLEPWPTGL